MDVRMMFLYATALLILAGKTCNSYGAVSVYSIVFFNKKALLPVYFCTQEK